MSMGFKKIFSKLYNILFTSLKGSGLSKYSIFVKLHVFLTRQLKSEFVEIYDLKLFLGKNDEGGYSSGNFYQNYYFDFLEKQISKGDVVIDIGAKIGVYSIALSKFVGSSGNVFSFEPTPESFEILRKNKEENSLNQLIIEQKAVTDKTSTELLELCEFSGNNRINNDCENGIPVECVSIDNYFSNFTKKISFIKIDVEGFEPKVFSGMISTLEKNPQTKILFEYNPKLMKFYGFKPIKFLENLVLQGFKLYDLEYSFTKNMSLEYFQKYENSQKLTNIFIAK